jgi:hypothetical protein
VVCVYSTNCLTEAEHYLPCMPSVINLNHGPHYPQYVTASYRSLITEFRGIDKGLCTDGLYFDWSYACVPIPGNTKCLLLSRLLLFSRGWAAKKPGQCLSYYCSEAVIGLINTPKNLQRGCNLSKPDLVQCSTGAGASVHAVSGVDLDRWDAETLVRIPLRLDVCPRLFIITIHLSPYHQRCII